jgi:hypothetical protein
MLALSLLKKSLLLAAALALILLGLAAPSAAQGDKSRIHLIHGLPGVKVDVEIAGAIAIEDFEFSDTEDLSALAGQTLADVKVKAAGTDTVAIDVGDLALPATGSITAIAHLDAAGKPVVSVFINDTSTIAAGQGRLVVRHTAAAPAVDVLAGDAVAFANVVNGKEGSAELPAGTISASVVAAGAKEPVVIGPADLPLTEGSALIVYAVGSLEANSLTVLTETLSGLDGSPTAVHTGNSPVSDNGGPDLPGYLALAGATLVVVGTGWSHGRRLVALTLGR